MRLFLAGIMMFSMMTAAFAQTPQDNSCNCQGSDCQGSNCAVVRTQAPEPGTPPSLKIPAIEKRTLSNGIPVWFAVRNNVPLVNIVLMVYSGASKDPLGKYGLAYITSELLSEGTEQLSSMEFAEAVDVLGANLSHSVNYDATITSLSVMKENSDKALHLMADSVINPAFHEKELERFRKQAEVSFRQMRQSPDDLGSIAFNRVIFGDDRYGTAAEGTAEQLLSITREDIINFHNDNFYPGNASLVVTGDVDPDAFMEKLEKEFGSWVSLKSKDKAPKIKRSEAAGIPGPRSMPHEGISPEKVKLIPQMNLRSDGQEVLVVNRPGSPQSLIRVGREGVARKTPDYFQLRAANTILGGSFMSRLNQNLRERNGYTYGARSGFAMRRQAGPFVVSTSVQSDKTGPAVKEIMNELANIGKPIPEQELQRACRYMAYSFPASFESSADLASRIAELQLYELADDYYDTYVGKLMSVEPNDVSRAVNLVIDPRRMAIVIVGDAESIVPQLEADGLTVKVVTIDDVIGVIPEVK